MAASARVCTPQARSYVRYQGQPGHHLLVLSFTGFDPFRSSAQPKSRTATGAQRAPEWHLAVRPSARDAPSPAAALVPDFQGLHSVLCGYRRKIFVEA